MRNRFVLLAALLSTVAAAACGPDLTPAAPSGPLTLGPLLEQTSEGSVAQVAGVWSGSLILTDVTGGTGIVAGAAVIECIGQAFSARLGDDNSSSLAIDQTGSGLTARLVSAETGLAGTYTGTASVTQVVLDAAEWDANSLNAICPDGTVRVVELEGSSIVADVSSRTPVELTGTVAHTYNVFDGDDNPVGGLVARFALNLARR